MRLASPFSRRKSGMLFTSLACACNDVATHVHNEPCDEVKYGNQVVKFFFQKKAATTTFTTNGGGGSTDIAIEANWDTLIASGNVNKIAAISNVSAAIRASKTGNIETGNEVPYGGVEMIDKEQDITFALKYFSQNTFRQLDQLQCWGLMTMWFLDNLNWLWGFSHTTGEGIPNATIIPATFGQEGIGTRNQAKGNKITWNNLLQPVPIRQLAFLASKDETYSSGS